MRAAPSLPSLRSGLRGTQRLNHSLSAAAFGAYFKVFSPPSRSLPVSPARFQHPARILLGLCLATVPAAAQDSAATRPAPRNGDANGKKVLTVDDYTRWRTIDASVISPDGKWVGYGMRFTNVVAPDAKPVLTIRNLDTNAEIGRESCRERVSIPEDAVSIKKK